MTTAAPPEKMMLADALNQIESAVVNFQLSHKEAMKEVLAGVSAARRLAPRVGDDVPDCNRQTEDACKDKPGCKMRKSAPPAASADERVLSAPMVDRASIYAKWVAGDNTLSFEERQRAHELIAALTGYRKRAARGVGGLEQAAQWCEARAKDKDVITPNYLNEAAREFRRRLSALPKGQEHEG